jgi:hypothetical protein
MLKHAKQFLVLCLIALQMAEPFIHAHAFELDSFKVHILHIHAGEISTASTGAGDSAQQAHLAQQHADTIFTVANGIKNTSAEDLAWFAIFFTFCLLIFNFSSRFIQQHVQALRYRHPHYSLQNPRAPPR